MKLFIKNMVSLRCKLAVKEELEKLGLQPLTVELGVVELSGSMTDAQRTQLRAALQESGLELMDDKRSILIERIKNVVIEMIHYLDEMPCINYSSYISKKIGRDYTYLANIFSKVKGMTIQQFIILHKIERVKELLVNEELNLTEVSYKLNYSSVAHLSYQFKKVTGQTPSCFKSLEDKKRIPLEEVEMLKMAS